MFVNYIPATYDSVQIHKHCGIVMWLWTKKIEKDVFLWIFNFSLPGVRSLKKEMVKTTGFEPLQPPNYEI